MKGLTSEQKTIKNILSSKKLAEYIKDNLKQSLKSIGFSKKLIQELVSNLDSLKINDFQKRYSKELYNVHTVGFFQKIVPEYFEKYVVPEIPDSENFLDVGCGTGILINRLSKTKRFKKLTGIDIIKYPEWKIFKGADIDFKIVKEDNFPSFLEKYKPDSLSITWTLHHMDKSQQKKYLKLIFSKLKNNSLVVILEDSYSEIMHPEKGNKIYKKFMGLNESERKKAMSVYDWIANRVLAQRKEVNVPFSYRTLEEWINLFKEVGFRCVSKKFIGFPDKRDINTPQILMVFKK